MRYTDLIEDIGLEGGYYGGDGNQHYMRCPFHEGSSNNFSIDEETGLWVCFREDCAEHGNIVQLVQRLQGINVIAALSYIERFERGYLAEVTQGDLDRVLLPQEDLEETPSETPLSRTIEGMTRERMPLWWRERGFDEDDWMAWDCMMDRNTGAVSIPVTMEGAFHGEILRRMPGAEPKYLYTKGFAKGQTLFGYDRAKRASGRLLLVEGALDAMWLWRHEQPAVAMLGASMSERQLRLLTTLRGFQLCTAFDNDSAGEEATKKITHRLIDAGFDVRRVRIPEPFKDVQDVRDSDTLRDIIDSSTPSWEWH